jgi:rfaE bifunctional protein nucleotidyltransferase chain/domain
MLNVNNLAQYYNRKIVDIDKAASIISALKSIDINVGLCHGGFDLMHPGHIKHFESAKEQCDFLVVSVTDDPFVSSRKGDGRPIFTAKLRAYMIANLNMVMMVVISPYKTGVEIINKLQPTLYIKGPDFIHKTTPGIEAERSAIQLVGGAMIYTKDEALSTTSIITYIQDEMTKKKLLLVCDRDGTLINDIGNIGKTDNWKELIKYRNDVISFLIKLQTKYRTTTIVVSNQSGVAKGLFNEDRVKEINKYLAEELTKKGLRIDNWQYCPDIDKSHYESHKDKYNYNMAYIKEYTKRKPSKEMILDGLQELNRKWTEYDKIIMIGDTKDDMDTALHNYLYFIDAKGELNNIDI